ncbi:hypothetical protein DESC_610129 [Desulfosarcina cetonica]|nr:hypothetical protein DESC_610129 [Desulfosarcina cetonica]
MPLLDGPARIPHFHRSSGVAAVSNPVSKHGQLCFGGGVVFYSLRQYHDGRFDRPKTHQSRQRHGFLVAGRAGDGGCSGLRFVRGHFRLHRGDRGGSGWVHDPGPLGERLPGEVHPGIDDHLPEPWCDHTAKHRDDPLLDDQQCLSRRAVSDGIRARHVDHAAGMPLLLYLLQEEGEHRAQADSLRESDRCRSEGGVLVTDAPGDHFRRDLLRCLHRQ